MFSTSGFLKVCIVGCVLTVACQNSAISENDDNDPLSTISICHLSQTDAYSPDEVNPDDYVTHLLHGDGVPDGPVPNTQKMLFTDNCDIVVDSENGKCPVGMAYIDGFCIDRWEASLAGHSPFDVPIGGFATTEPLVIPQGYISGNVAEVVCKAAGKRLCTGSEWNRSCQGFNTSTFPYGNAYVIGACNEGRQTHPVIEIFGTQVDWSSTQMNDSRINQLPNSLDLTGSNPGCMTEEGVFDMHGNLHEWVAEEDGTFRGGFYVDARINGQGCTYATTAHGKEYHDYSTGFRCCADNN